MNFLSLFLLLHCSLWYEPPSSPGLDHSYNILIGFWPQLCLSDPFSSKQPGSVLKHTPDYTSLLKNLQWYLNIAPKLLILS